MVALLLGGQKLLCLDALEKKQVGQRLSTTSEKEVPFFFSFSSSSSYSLPDQSINQRSGNSRRTSGGERELRLLDY